MNNLLFRAASNKCFLADKSALFPRVTVLSVRAQEIV